MRIVKNNVELIKNTIPGKKMEYCGRVCYKSDSNINDTSYIKFLQNIYKSGHCSVLEHERVIIRADLAFVDEFERLKYFNCVSEGASLYISANVRAWVNYLNSEHLFYPLFKEVYPFLFEEENTLYAKSNTIKIVKEEEVPESIRKYIDSKTFKIIASRACTHQLVRHRVFSFSQQSQRYCNFSGDKFNHSIDFIMPIIDDVKSFSLSEKETVNKIFEEYFKASEDEYFNLVDSLGVRPEDARSVLPNAAASIIVMTGTTYQWEEFFKLRCDKHAQKEIRDVANKIKEILNNKKETSDKNQ